MERVPPEFRDEYREYDREFTIRKTRLGCFIGIILVPLFSVLDYTVYPGQAREFLLVRLICSLLMAALFPILNTDFGRKYYHLQGVAILFLPTAAIGWMIFRDPAGGASPYYAGLNLVLMILAVVLDWTFWQSVALVTMTYIGHAWVRLHLPPAYDEGLSYQLVGQAMIWSLYLPCTLLVLRRRNAGHLPAWLERRISKWPPWLRGTPVSE